MLYVAEYLIFLYVSSIINIILVYRYGYITLEWEAWFMKLRRFVMVQVKTQPAAGKSIYCF